VRANVGHVEAVDAPREVPGRDQSGREEERIEGERFRRASGKREDQRIFDLAVPVLTRLGSEAGADEDGRGRVQAGGRGQ